MIRIVLGLALMLVAFMILMGLPVILDPVTILAAWVALGLLAVGAVTVVRGYLEGVGS